MAAVEEVIELAAAVSISTIVYAALVKVLLGGVRMARISRTVSDWMIAAGLAAIILLPLAFEVLRSPVGNIADVITLTFRAAVWSAAVVIGGIATMFGWDLLVTANRRL